MSKLGRVLSSPLIVAVTTCLAMASASAAGPSTQFSLTGAISAPATYTAADLAALPAVTQTVSFGSGSGPQTHTYIGASLWGIVEAAGIALDPAVKNDVLNRYLLATGSDGYRAVFALGELNPDFGNQPDLIAYAADGVLLDDTGFARIVAPNDVRGGRWVSNLVSLEVFSAAAPVPEPAGAALLLVGLAALGWRARTRPVQTADPGT